MNSAFDVRKLFASCLWNLLICSHCFGALALTSPIHNEDFNFLASTGTTNVWNNDQGSENANGSPGWWWFGDNSTGYDASDGSSSTPDLTSFGVDSDRAMGSLTGGANDFTVWSLVIQNNLSAPITALTVSFTGEQWRDADVPTNTVTFSYKTSSVATDFNQESDFGDDPVADVTWTANPNLNFTGTDDLAGDVAVNPPRQFARNDTLTVNVPVGEFIALRWHDGNFSSLSDHGLAIDDLTITATTAAIPEPSALLFGGLVCGILGLEYARRKVTKKSPGAAAAAL
jgi:hypothetical protein